MLKFLVFADLHYKKGMYAASMDNEADRITLRLHFPEY